MHDDNANEIECTEEREVFRNQYASVFDDLVRFPSGATGAYLRFRWLFPFGVAVLPIVEGSKAILIQQYSYSLSRWVLQVPKGMGSNDLSPIEVAEKELREEIGASAKLELLRTMYADPGIISNPIHVFVAHDVKFDTKTFREHSELIGDLVEIDLLGKSTPGLVDIEDAVTLAALLQFKSQLHTT